METLNIGLSADKVMIYDKVAQHKSEKAAGLKKISSSEPCTRIEIKLAPKCHLGELGKLKNPFTELRIYDLGPVWDGMKIGRSMQRLFVHTAQIAGINPALNMVTEDNVRNYLRRMAKESRLTAFQSQARQLWQPYLSALKAYGIKSVSKDPAKVIGL